MADILSPSSGMEAELTREVPREAIDENEDVMLTDEQGAKEYLEIHGEDPGLIDEGIKTFTAKKIKIAEGESEYAVLNATSSVSTKNSMGGESI